MTAPRKTLSMTDELFDYAARVALREPEILRRLREETRALPHAGMQIGPDQGQFLALLVRLIGARKTLEIGVFTGYSSLAVALALPPGGRIIACDVSAEYTAVARRYWKAAGVEDAIDLRIAPAIETLDGLIAGGAAETFDFAFIDADKTGYDAYYERALVLLRSGGLIALDNVFWSGRVADPTVDHDPDTEALRALNAKIGGDERVDVSMLCIGDGVTLARKR